MVVYDLLKTQGTDFFVSFCFVENNMFFADCKPQGNNCKKQNICCVLW